MAISRGVSEWATQGWSRHQLVQTPTQHRCQRVTVIDQLGPGGLRMVISFPQAPPLACRLIAFRPASLHFAGRPQFHEMAELPSTDVPLSLVPAAARSARDFISCSFEGKPARGANTASPQIARSERSQHFTRGLARSCFLHLSANLAHLATACRHAFRGHRNPVETGSTTRLLTR